jgi:hypothetical protein
MEHGTVMLEENKGIIAKPIKILRTWVFPRRFGLSGHMIPMRRKKLLTDILVVYI